MPRDARTYLEDMLEACERIQSLTEPLSLGEYVSNDTVKWAVER